MQLNDAIEEQAVLSAKVNQHQQQKIGIDHSNKENATVDEMTTLRSKVNDNIRLQQLLVANLRNLLPPVFSEQLLPTNRKTQVKKNQMGEKKKGERRDR